MQQLTVVVASSFFVSIYLFCLKNFIISDKNLSKLKNNSCVKMIISLKNHSVIVNMKICPLFVVTEIIWLKQQFVIFKWLNLYKYSAALC